MNDTRGMMVRALWEEVFCEDTASFLDYYCDRKMAENEVDVVVASIDREEAGEVKNAEDTHVVVAGQELPPGRRVISMIHWNPYRIVVSDQGCHVSYKEALSDQGSCVPYKETPSNQCFRVPYIVGVATAPDYRHRGHMAALLTEGLRREARRGTPFVWLIPADGAIYTPFGFRYAGARYRTVLPEIMAKVQPELRGTNGKKIVSVTRVDGDLTKEVSSFLNARLSELFDLFAVRDEAYLADARAQYESDGGGIAAILCQGHVEGFFTWWPEDEGITVREMVLSKELEEEGLETLEQLLRKWFDTARVSLRTRELRRFVPSAAPILLDKSRICPETQGGSEQIPNIYTGKMTVYTTGWTGDEVVETPVVNVMLRVADVRRFLELFRASRAYRLRVKITDEFIPDNNRIYDWEVGPEGAVAVQASPVGKSSVVSDHDDDTTKPWDLEISAEELALWLLGGQKKGKMMKNGAYADIFPMTRIHLPECV